MKKKIMILGATYTQVPLICAAKELGYLTVVTSTPGDYPGFNYADEICYADISNPLEVYDEANKLKINGIATCCMDTGVKSIGYVSEKLGLCGLTENAARLSNNKYLMKIAFEENGVNTAKYRKVSNLDELKMALKQLSMPTIVKAIDLQGSRGIFIVKNEDEAVKGFKQAMEATEEDFCVIEEFIEGEEFGAQAFIYRGEIIFVLPHGDNTYMYNTAIPIGHYAPLTFSEDILKKTKEQVALAIKAIGLDNCAINVDLILKDNQVYVIELTGRAGATCLPELVSIYYGIDYYKMIVLMAMGEDPRNEFNKKNKICTANASRFLLSEKDGIIKKIINTNLSDDKNIFNITIDVKPGSVIKKFTDGRDRLGQVIVIGENSQYCLKKIEEVISNIEFVIDRQ